LDFLSDPSMREIVEDFCQEANDLFADLETSLDEFEDDPSSAKSLETFGQVIDRIMGAAKSIGAHDIAMFCELGKIIGYKSSQTKDPALLSVVIAVLFDAVDLLKKMVAKIQSGEKDSKLEGLSTEAFGSRLKWLSDKFKDIERASCTMENSDPEDEKELDQNSIDDLMASLGL